MSLLQPMERVKELGRKALAMFDALDRREKYMVGGGLGLLLTFMSLMAIFHESILHAMASFSDEFHQIRFGWLILFFLYVIISFPPMIGYSVLSLFTGMVYGFPGGWPLLASSTVLGSFASFITFRYLLRDRAAALAQQNIKFMAFSKTLEQDSFVLLWLIRLCPLPYSLSNAAMSSVPSVEPYKFFLATVCTTPKLFLHIFIGSRLGNLSRAKDSGTRWANAISISIALIVGIVTSYIIYRRTTERAAVLEAEHRRQHGQGPVYSSVADTGDIDNFEIDDDEIEHDALDDDGFENPFDSTSDTHSTSHAV